MDSSLLATIDVVPGDSNGSDEKNRNGVRRVPWPGGYYTAKLPPSIVPMTWGVPKHPLRPTATKRQKRIDHCASFTQRKPRPWLVDNGRDPLEAGLLEKS